MIHIATVKSSRYYENFNQSGETPSAEENNQQMMTEEMAATPMTTPETQDIQEMPSAPTPAPAQPANPGGPLVFDVSGDTFALDDSSGQIIVQVRTARGTQPVPEAAVIIYKNRDGKNEVVSFSLTNEDGTTPTLSLPAPKKADAQTPSDSLPFADYNIAIRHPMFYTAMLNNVQIFGDELTIQAVELIPLPEFVNEKDTTKTVNIPKQNL